MKLISPFGDPPEHDADSDLPDQQRTTGAQAGFYPMSPMATMDVDADAADPDADSAPMSMARMAPSPIGRAAAASGAGSNLASALQQEAGGVQQQQQAGAAAAPSWGGLMSFLSAHAGDLSVASCQKARGGRPQQQQQQQGW